MCDTIHLWWVLLHVNWFGGIFTFSVCTTSSSTRANFHLMPMTTIHLCRVLLHVNWFGGLMNVEERASASVIYSLFLKVTSGFPSIFHVNADACRTHASKWRSTVSLKAPQIIVEDANAFWGAVMDFLFIILTYSISPSRALSCLAYHEKISASTQYEIGNLN